MSRRTFLKSLGVGGAVGLHPLVTHASGKNQLELATFRFDVTPPLGHSLCGGWIKPVEAVDDSLEAIGVVLLGAGKPIVLCAVDWTGLLNDANRRIREVIAGAVETSPDRVAVHCVHQHNAPFACLNAQEIVGEQAGLPHIVRVDYFDEVLARASKSARKALSNTRPLTHVAMGAGRVEKVASNRRIFRDDQGKIVAMRGSSCKDPKLRAMTEGKVDPLLRTVAFYSGQEKVAACHYYATHPMSYYGDGRVSSDFVGIARKRLQVAERECTHLYFTGCAGNVSAGKYNDGSQAQRPILAERISAGLHRAAAQLKPLPIESLQWRTADLLPVARDGYDIDQLEQQIQDEKQRVVNRNRPAYRWAWMKRLERKEPVILSSLHIQHSGAVSNAAASTETANTETTNTAPHSSALLHLPAESFIEYQLRANQMLPGQFLATAAYGDGGPWYIPTADEYPAGGYEVSVAFSEPSIDGLMTDAIKQLLL